MDINLIYMKDFFEDITIDEEKENVENKLRKLVKLSKETDKIVYDTYDGIFYILGDFKELDLPKNKVESIFEWLEKYYDFEELEDTDLSKQDFIKLLKEKINTDIEFQNVIKDAFKNSDGKKFNIVELLINSIEWR